jgi:hypothetical protein
MRPDCRHPEPIKQWIACYLFVALSCAPTKPQRLARPVCMVKLLKGRQCMGGCRYSHARTATPSARVRHMQVAIYEHARCTRPHKAPSTWCVFFRAVYTYSVADRCSL